MIYQAGEPDQFMHRYQYDSDNRITEVETSKDGKIWENDASYFYYSHGPLARTEIGDKKVQGIDYAYTIQGWIKGVNSEELAPAFDMGHDGGTTSTLPSIINSQVAQDAFGYSLSYFEGDYQSRIAGVDNFLRYSKNLPSSSANLYNGNIRDMYTAIMKDDETPLGTYNYQYQYDQLNRIKAMNSQGLSLSGSTIIPVAGLYETTYNYDRNGNLTGLRRWADNGTTKTAMDEFTYDYITGTNKLAAVHDAVNAGNFTEDLDDQPGQYTGLGFTAYNLADEATHNYRYDAIGQLVQDKTEEIENIEWTVTGKVKKIERYAFSEKPDLAFDYDPMGQRITKTVYPKSAPGVIDVAGVKKTYYIRDAQGNVMTVYTLKAEDGETNLYLTERNLYGSSRLGVEQVNQIVASTEPTNIDINTAQQRVVGDKRYELSNHLGNVLAVVTDRKIPEFDAVNNLTHYLPNVVSFSDYYPFGMQMPNRNGSTDDYRYGFQGQEKDDEIKGEGNSVNYKFRMHDPRVGRFFAVDPLGKEFPWNSSYAFSENRVVDAYELEGLECVTFHYGGGAGGGGAVKIQKTLAVDIDGNIASFSTVSMGFAYGAFADVSIGIGGSFNGLTKDISGVSSTVSLEGGEVLYLGGSVSAPLTNEDKIVVFKQLSGGLGAGLAATATVDVTVQEEVGAMAVYDFAEPLLLANPITQIPTLVNRGFIKSLSGKNKSIMQKVKEKLVNEINVQRSLYKVLELKEQKMLENKEAFSESEFKDIRSKKSDAYDRIKLLREKVKQVDELEKEEE